MRLLPAPLLGLVLVAPVCAELPEPPPPLPPTDLATPDQPGPVRPVARQFTELVPALIEALKDSDPDVRQHTALALAAIGADALKPLRDALKDTNKDLRAGAAYALGQMGYTGRDAIPELVKTLKDDDPNVRRAAAQAVSRIVSSESRVLNSGSYRTAVVAPPPLPLPSNGIFPASPELPKLSRVPDSDKLEKSK